MISEFEQKRREKGWAYAKASVALEGGRVSALFETKMQQYISGELELSDLRQYVDTHILKKIG